MTWFCQKSLWVVVNLAVFLDLFSRQNCILYFIWFWIWYFLSSQLLDSTLATGSAASRWLESCGVIIIHFDVHRQKVRACINNIVYSSPPTLSRLYFYWLPLSLCLVFAHVCSLRLVVIVTGDEALVSWAEPLSSPSRDRVMWVPHTTSPDTSHNTNTGAGTIHKKKLRLR